MSQIKLTYYQWHEIRESDKAGNEKLSRGRLTRKLFR